MTRDGIRRDTGDIARGAGVNYLGFLARLGTRTPFLFLAGLLFGAERFGQYVFAVAVVELVGQLALFGLKRSLFKFMSDAVERREPVAQPIAHGLALALATGGAAALVRGPAAPLLAVAFRSPSAAATLRVLALAVPLIVIADTMLAAIRFTRQMRYEVAARSVVEPLALSGAVALLYVLGVQEVGLAIAYVASLGAASGTALWALARVFSLREIARTPLRPRTIRDLVRFTGPTALYDLLLLVSARLDILLVTYFLPTATVGAYGMATQFAGFAKKIKQGVDAILTPVVSQGMAARDMARVRAQLALVTRWVLALELFPTLLFVFFGSVLLGLVGTGFAAAGPALALLMVAESVQASFGVSELPLVYGHPKRNIVAGALTLASGATLLVVTIPALGMNGAAVALIATYTLANVYRAFANRASFGFLPFDASVLRPLAAALPIVIGALVAAAALGPSLPGQMTQAVLVVVGYPLVAYRVVLSPVERRELWKLLGRTPRLTTFPTAHPVE